MANSLWFIFRGFLYVYIFSFIDSIVAWFELWSTNTDTNTDTPTRIKIWENDIIQCNYRCRVGHWRVSDIGTCLIQGVSVLHREHFPHLLQKSIGQWACFLFITLWHTLCYLHELLFSYLSIYFVMIML